MPRRLWTMPMLGFLRGTDARPIANGFQTIGEYLRGHVGFWGSFSGTTVGLSPTVFRLRLGLLLVARFTIWVLSMSTI
jgi:hypothetical protein